MKRVLSTTRVMRSSLCPDVVVEFLVEVDPERESLSMRRLGECP